jgi:predicted ATPase
LLIDQPEENLDPKSVYSEPVRLFGEAWLRRQVIIVIHNANLVVHTDVDQVSVASCVKPESGSLLSSTTSAAAGRSGHTRPSVGHPLR